MARICLNHLTGRYGPVLAVDDFTATLQPGKITGFRGPSGAGTTITVRMPVELTRPTAGAPIVAGSTPGAGRGDRPIRCALARPCCPPGRASFHRDPPPQGYHGCTCRALVVNKSRRAFGNLMSADTAPSAADRSRARLICGRFGTTSCCLVRV